MEAGLTRIAGASDYIVSRKAPTNATQAKQARAPSKSTANARRLHESQRRARPLRCAVQQSGHWLRMIMRSGLVGMMSVSVGVRCRYAHASRYQDRVKKIACDSLRAQIA